MDGTTPSSALSLSNRALTRLPAQVKRPEYERGGIRKAIVHLGVGGFHRAHQAVYTDSVIAAGDRSWGICGAGIMERDAAMRDALAPQDYLYTVVARTAESEEARVVGSIIDFTLGANGSKGVIARLADPETRIISLTVTENGYHFRGDTGELDFESPVIQSDLRDPRHPKSVIGYLAECLRLVRAEGRRPPTVLSCDNLPHNGRRLRGLVTAYARRIDPELAAFIDGEVSFPCTMVDRITPATRDRDRVYLREHFGIEDRWPVFCEGFIQWVIEDDFPLGRPDWSTGGAQFVADVIPYELMKIRLLNGSHSALSYLAYLLGHRDVDKAMADPLVAEFVTGYMGEIEPTVGAVPGIDLRQYRKTLIARFSNPAISDQVARLAMEGSRKIPNSVADPLRELLSRNLPVSHIAFAIAAWIRFLAGKDESGAPIEIDDPYRDRIMAAAAESIESAAPFLAMQEVFPEQIAANTRFVESVTRYLREIRRLGVKGALVARSKA